MLLVKQCQEYSFIKNAKNGGFVDIFYIFIKNYVFEPTNIHAYSCIFVVSNHYGLNVAGLAEKLALLIHLVIGDKCVEVTENRVVQHPDFMEL